MRQKVDSDGAILQDKHLPPEDQISDKAPRSKKPRSLIWKGLQWI